MLYRLSRHAPPTGYAGWKGKGCRDEENRPWYVDRGGLPVRRRGADRRCRACRGGGPYRRPTRDRPAGRVRAVPLAVRDATFSNLAAVPERQVILAPGDAAVVTAMSADELPRCTISWTLAVRLPGSAAAATVPAPRGVFVPCLGGPLT